MSYYGKQPDVASCGDIWPFPVPYYVQRQPSTVGIRSNTDSDQSPNSGAWRVYVEGVNSWTGQIESEIVTLQGTITVFTEKQFVAVNMMEVVEFGSDQHNKGTITASAAHRMFNLIPAGAGRSQSAIVAVPAFHTYRVTSLAVGTVETNTQAGIDVELRTFGRGIANGGWRTVLGANSGTRHFDTHLQVPGPSVLKACCAFSSVRSVWCELRGFMVQDANQSTNR